MIFNIYLNQYGMTEFKNFTKYYSSLKILKAGNDRL